MAPQVGPDFLECNGAKTRESFFQSDELRSLVLASQSICVGMRQTAQFVAAKRKKDWTEMLHNMLQYSTLFLLKKKMCKAQKCLVNLLYKTCDK